MENLGHNEIKSSSPLELQAANLFCEIKKHGPSSEELSQERLRLAELVQDTANLYPNPDQHRAVEITGGIYDWIFFGDTGEPLPRGLVKVIHPKTKAINVRIDINIINPKDIETVQDVFFDGSGTFQTKAWSGFEYAVEDTIKQAEGYKIIQSLIAGEPLPDSGDQPLPIWMRIVRESQINSEIRRKLGIGPNEVVMQGTPSAVEFDMALKRANYLLDEETVRKPIQESSDVDSKNKIREFFKPYILKCMQDKYMQEYKVTDKHEEVADIEYGDGDLIGLSKDGKDITCVRRLYLAKYYNKIRPRGSLKMDELFESIYLEKICENLWNPETQSDSIESISAKVIGEITDWIKDCLLEVRPEERYLNMLAFLRSTPGEAKVLTRYQPVEKIIPRNNSVQFVSEKEQQRLKSEYVGEVFRNKSTVHRGLRLIQQQTLINDLPVHSNNSSLIVAFDKCQDGKMPFIPGYRVVSFDPETKKWGFEYNSDEDPYAGCDVELPLDSMEGLIREYEGIGLTDLVKQLRKLTQPTVEDLVRCIKENTDYATVENDSTERVGALSQFRPYVRQNKLFLQCTASSIFLQRSLEVLYEDSTAIQHGHTFSPRQRFIDNMTHAQVSFTFNGRNYLLDSTGSSYEGYGIGSFSFARMFTRVRRNNPSASLPKEVQQADHVSELQPEVPSDFTEDNLEQNQYLFELQLMNIFNLHDVEQLHEKLVSLSEHDPVRVSFQALLNIENENGLQNAYDYIQLISNAEYEDLKRVGFEHYKDHEILQVIKNSIEKALILRGSRSEQDN